MSPANQLSIRRPAARTTSPSDTVRSSPAVAGVPEGVSAGGGRHGAGHQPAPVWIGFRAVRPAPSAFTSSQTGGSVGYFSPPSRPSPPSAAWALSPILIQRGAQQLVGRDLRHLRLGPVGPAAKGKGADADQGDDGDDEGDET